jgi:hypothetical protein
LYFLPLGGLLAVGLTAELLERRGAARIVGVACCVLTGILVVEYAAQWNTSMFYVWQYDADSRTVLERIDRQRKGRRPIRAAVSWQLEPSFNFYRVVRGLTWLSPVDRSGPAAGGEYHAVIPQDREAIAGRGLREIYRGPVSGVVLAAK